MRGIKCKGIKEKPQVTFLVNAGIYLLEPSVYHLISKGEHLDMTALIQRLLNSNRCVVSFPIIEYWLDIGQPADYQKAQEDRTTEEMPTVPHPTKGRARREDRT